MDERIVYLTGKYLPLSQANISVMDRGFLFGDGVYEIIPIFNGKPFRGHQHLQRLRNSVKAIRLNMTFEEEACLGIFNELMQRNPDQGDNRVLYVQITRGVANNRDHVFPEQVQPTIFAQCTPMQPLTEAQLSMGGHAITAPDIRWAHCYIKAITLLPNILYAQQAKEAGAKEVIMLRDGMAKEGVASNLFVVKNGTLITPPADESILRGITRDLILELADNHHIPYFERPIPVKTLHEVDEVWMTGSLKEIFPIVQVDDFQIGSGKVGEMWRRFYKLYQEYKTQ